jgi:hypothetical protein
MARRPVLEPDQDAIQIALATNDELPAHFYGPEQGETSEEIGTLSLPTLRERVSGATAELNLARQLANARAGRHAALARPIMKHLPHNNWSCYQHLAKYLRTHAVIAAKEGRADDSLLFGRAILGVARAASEPPMLMSVLMASACRSISCQSLLQAIQYGEASESALAEAQADLEATIAVPLMLESVRGERAFFADLVHAYERGDISDAEASAKPHWLCLFLMPRSTIESYYFQWRYGSPIEKRRASLLLRYYNALVELLKSSPDGPQLQSNVMQRVGQETGYVTRRSALAAQRMLFVDRMSRSYLACVTAALAVERYRLTTGRWPSSMVEVPGCLENVPLNPHTLDSVVYHQHRGYIAINARGRKYESTGGVLPLVGGWTRGDKKAVVWDLEQRQIMARQSANLS